MKRQHQQVLSQINQKREMTQINKIRKIRSGASLKDQDKGMGT